MTATATATGISPAHDNDECLDMCGNSGQLGQLVSCIASECKNDCF